MTTAGGGRFIYFALLFAKYGGFILGGVFCFGHRDKQSCVPGMHKVPGGLFYMGHMSQVGLFCFWFCFCFS